MNHPGKAQYGVSKKRKPLPAPAGKEFLVLRWGEKKRDRYLELIKNGISFEKAFEAVEYNRGELPK
jgi:hypothetical protein